MNSPLFIKLIDVCCSLINTHFVPLLKQNYPIKMVNELLSSGSRSQVLHVWTLTAFVPAQADKVSWLSHLHSHGYLIAETNNATVEAWMFLLTSVMEEAIWLLHSGYGVKHTRGSWFHGSRNHYWKILSRGHLFKQNVRRSQEAGSNEQKPITSAPFWGYFFISTELASSPFLLLPLPWHGPILCLFSQCSLIFIKVLFSFNRR